MLLQPHGPWQKPLPGGGGLCHLAGLPRPGHAGPSWRLDPEAAHLWHWLTWVAQSVPWTGRGQGAAKRRRTLWGDTPWQARLSGQAGHRGCGGAESQASVGVPRKPRYFGSLSCAARCGVAGRGEVRKTQRIQQGAYLKPRTHPGWGTSFQHSGVAGGAPRGGGASTRQMSSLEGCPAQEAPTCACECVHASVSVCARARGHCKGRRHPTCVRPGGQPQILNSQPPRAGPAPRTPGSLGPVPRRKVPAALGKSPALGHEAGVIAQPASEHILVC